MVENEKRSAPREAVHFVTEIELDGQRLGCGVSRDASGAGLLLLTYVEPAVGSHLTLHLHLPAEPEAAARVLEATVVRTESIPLAERALWSYRIGVQFEQPPDDMQELIASVVRLRSKEPAPP
jgi:hypothetical protein